MKYSKIAPKISAILKGVARLWPLILFNLFPLAVLLVYQELTNPAPTFKYAPDTSSYIYEASNEIFKVGIGSKEDGKPEVNFENKDGDDIKFTFLSKENTETKLESAGSRSLIFRNIDKNIDLEYETLGNGVKEWIILNSSIDRDFFVFNVNNDSLDAQQNYRNLQAPGFLDKKGDYAFNIDKGYAIDALGKTTYNVSIRYIQRDKKNYLKVDVDPQWLNDEARVYPIRIDPTIVYDESSEFAAGSFDRVQDTGSGSSPILETAYKELAADSYTDGLWRMNETANSTCTAGADVCDSSGNGLNGAATGTTIVDGLKGKARSYNGTSDYVSIADSNYLDIGSGDFTVEAWVKMDTSTGDEFMLSKGTINSTGYHLSLENSGYIFFRALNKNISNQSTSYADWVASPAQTINDNKWHYIAAQEDGTYLKIYLDGELVAYRNTGNPGDKSTATALNIGRRSDGVSYTSGTIDEIRISNIPRSAEEIKNAYRRYSSSVYTSDVIDLSTPVTTWNDFTWSELGVQTGDGETVYDNTNLATQWNFNETSGTTANNDAEGTSCGGTPSNCDLTLSGFDSTSSQDSDPDSTWTANNRKLGAGALQFDGINSYLYKADPNALDFGTGNFTVAVWVKSTSTTDLQTIIDKRDTTSTSNGYLLGIRSDGVHVFIKDALTNSAELTSKKGIIGDGAWHNLVAVFNRTSNQIYLYIDGILDNSLSISSVTNSVSNNGQIVVGYKSYSGSSWSYFGGILDSTRLYSRALSASEVLSNYNSSNIEFQTRVGTDSTPDDGNWEAWKPTTSETQVESFDVNPTTWDYRKSITVTNNIASVLSNYQVLLDLDTQTLITAGKMESDCSDIRFADSDGTTLIDHWVESGCNTSSTKIWIEVPSIPSSSSTTIYLNYGSPSASSVSSVANTFVAGTVYHFTGTCPSGDTNCNGMDNHTEADYIRSTLSPSSTSTPDTINDSTGADNFFRRYRFLFVADTTGTHNFGTNSDDGSEVAIFPEDGYGGGYNTSHPYGAHTVVGSYYGNHGSGTCGSVGTPGSSSLTAGQGYWIDYMMTEVGGGQLAQLCINEGSGYQTLSATNFPNQIYRREYTNGTEPTVGTPGSEASSTYSEVQDFFDSGIADSINYSADTDIKAEGTGSQKVNIGQLSVDSNTVALWHLDETNGDNAGSDVFDATSNNYDGEFDGTNIATAVVNGISGKARSFNGSDDQITTNNVMSATDNVTIEGWFKPSSASNNTIVVYNGTSSSNGYGLVINGGNWNLLRGGIAWDTGGLSVDLNVWQHIALVRSSGTWYVYKNGIKSSSITTSAPNTPTAHAKIGWGDANGYYNGVADEVRLSNIARTAEEITENYRLSKEHYINKTLSFTDLSNKDSLPFYIAADKPGTYLASTIGESAYSNFQTDSNTIGLWHFDELANDTCSGGTYDACDDSGNLHHANETNGSVIVSGKQGNARKYDGTNDYVSVSNSADFNFTSAYTLEAWVNIDNLAASTEHFVISRYDWSANTGYGIDIYSSGQVRCDFNGGSGAFATSAYVTVGKWYHIACVYNGSQLQVYLNGTLKDSVARSSLSNTNTNLYFGTPANGVGSDTFTLSGMIDEVRISNIARTANEIRQQYEIGHRTHPITISFGASLDSGNLIANSSDTSFTINAKTKGLNKPGSMLFPGDKIIVKEVVDDTEYIAQGTVTSVTESTGAVTISSWDSGGTFPSGGFTQNATVFKWQREYWDLTGILDSQIDAVTKLTLRVTNGNEGRTIWLDDLESVGDYLTDPTGSTITSSLGDQYFQYRTVFTSSDSNVSAQLTDTTLDYIANNAPNTPTLDSPTDRSKQLLTPQLQTTADDDQLDDLQYKIVLCKNPSMTYSCQTFDQTSSQTGWSGQDAQSNTMYASGTQATYTIQSDLDAGATYYWKSYAIDPNGVNGWSETQTTPYVLYTNASPRAATINNYEHYIARRENPQTATSSGWNAIIGTANSGTTASTNGWIDSANLTTGDKYLIMVWGEHNTDSTSATSGLRVKHGSAPFTESQTIEKTENTSTSHKTPYNWFTVWTASSGEDLEVELYWGGEAGTQARVEDVTLVAINAEELISNNDIKYDIDTTGGTLDTSFTSKVSLSWTPANDGDPWWILSYSQADIQDNTSNITYESHLNINSNAYNTQQIGGNAQFIGDTPIYAISTITTLADSANSISLDIKESGADQSWDSAGIMALRLNAFLDFFFDSNTDAGPTMDTASAWVEQLNSDPTILIQNNWLVAAGGLVQDDGAQVVSRIQNSDINITDDVGGWTKANNEPLATNLADVYTTWTAGLKNVDFDAQTTQTGTANILDGWLAGISMEKYTDSPGPSPDLPTNGATNQSIRPQLKTTSIDADANTLKYKIQMCENLAMTTNCQTFDQSASQTGWSGQNANSSTRYQSGTQATYTVQSDLQTNTTYYWRAYAIDPNGVNQFSAPGEIFSFTTTTAPSQPTSLLAEGEATPDEVSDSTPELSAIHNDPNGDSANYYQIQVNTAYDFTGTVMWNPGKQSMSTTADGARSPDISYAGNTLQVGTTYYWRIKFWDTNGAEGSWSDAAQFTMADLNKVLGCYVSPGTGYSSIVVHWQDTNTIEDGYRILRSVNGGAFSTLIDKAADTTSHSDSSISAGNTYTYRISGKLGATIGDYCETETASVSNSNLQFEGIVFN